MKKPATLFITLGIVVIAASAAFGQKRLVTNTNWKLSEAEGRTVFRSAASISFDASAEKFSGNTGCNSMSGSVDIRGKNIDFGTIRTTERMCKMMAGSVPENVILDALRNARKFDVRGATLSLFDRMGRTLLRFTRGEKTDNVGTKLEDRKWVLEQIKGRQTFVALPYAFLNFDPKRGSAGGNTSCNVFGGNYKTSGSTITFSNIIATMRACVEDDSKMSTEREMMDGLRRANRYDIRDGRLSLYRGIEILLTFRGEDK